MPMIDVQAPAGTFPDPQGLARKLAATLMEVEQVPDIPLFRANTAAFVNQTAAISDVDGSPAHVRVVVLTPPGVLNRDKQLAAVQRLTADVAEAAGDPSLAGRTWVLLTESVDGGWGIGGRALTTADIAGARPA